METIYKCGFKRLWALGFGLWALSCQAQLLTTNTYQMYNSDGSAMTNPLVFTPWPISGGSVTVVGNNLVWARVVTNYPSPSGAGTNIIEPGTYRLTMTPAAGLTISTYFNAPATTNILPITAYISNAPAIYTSSSLYAFLTNGLGGPPGLVQALQFQPATNSPAGITNVLGFALTAPVAGFTGTLSNSAAGINFRVNYTNGLAISTNTP